MVSVFSFLLAGEERGPFLSTFAFALAIFLTNLDRVPPNKTIVVCVGLLLSFAAFLITIIGVVMLSKALGSASQPLGTAIGATLMYLVCSVYIRIDFFKTGLTITIASALAVIPFVELIKQTLTNTSPFGILTADPGLYFICWQTLVGFGISVGVWLKSEEMPATNNS
ncbi:hypothetical protein TH61_03025 [Rufibacter sp. DG15C]|nr:hypothetical protein TH61_03025 [Rufibacter sp. DG15C]